MAAGAAAAAEMERATEEAAGLVTFLLPCGRSLVLHESVHGWHPTVKLSLAESFALLWQDDSSGGTVSHAKTDDAIVRLCAAHLLDLLLVGRIKIAWSTVEKNRSVALSKQLRAYRIIIVNTEPTGVAATDQLMARLIQMQDERKEAGKEPVGLVKFLEQHIDFGTKQIGKLLEDETFDGLVQRGIVTKQTRKKFIFFEKDVYPTANPKPERQLVHDLRSVMKLEMEPTLHLDMLLKLIARTTKLFTPEEEKEDPSLAARRKKYKSDAEFSLMRGTRDYESSRTSPLVANPELSMRFGLV